MKVESSLEDILTKLESKVNCGDEEVPKHAKILAEVRKIVIKESKSRKKGFVPRVLLQKLNTAPVEDTIYDEEEEMIDVKVEPEETQPLEVDSLEDTKPVLDSLNISVMQCNVEENEAGDKPESEAQSFIISSGVTQKRVKEEIRPGIPKKPKKCRFCPKLFLFRNSYKTHVEREHSDPLSTENVEASENGSKFKCQHCPKAFLRHETLKNHLVLMHVDLLSPEEFKELARFKCKFCGKYFRHLTNLNIHLVCHTGATPFKCTWCGISYAFKHGLSVHIRRHHRQDKHTQEENWMEKKTENEADDKPENEAQPDIISSEVQSDVQKSSELQRKLKKCRFCPKMFLFWSTYKTHVEREHSAPLSTEKVRAPENLGGGGPTENKKCRHCSKSFPRSDNLRRHLVMKHTDLLSPEEFKQLAKFKCKFCGKYYRDLHALNTHIVCHTGAKPFKCSWCGITYAFKHGLSQHIRVHHPGQEKTLVGRENKNCTGAFAIKNEHCSEKKEDEHEQIVCEICNKKFKSARSLKLHSYWHVRYECKYCGIKLRNVGDLNAHLVVHLGAP